MPDADDNVNVAIEEQVPNDKYGIIYHKREKGTTPATQASCQDPTELDSFPIQRIGMSSLVAGQVVQGCAKVGRPYLAHLRAATNS